ncbi:MAG: helix-turn-helix domain-containing protein [Solirubrobacterales bacterium]|nr:helix-turn-helix domain-containing protein [Solirubrobacterales bacterium]MCB8971561.1 helix-turn-helix domain-containing protein [Thermoleophilales bacterium]MCO5327052.1 helix-turn-helix domain-containing protein [Solirubrobacterales bacterium]
MRAKTEERNRARKLRSKGWSLREIAAELGVALSSVSTWVRDVPIPQPKPATRALVGGVPLRSIPVIADPSKLRRCCRCRLRKPLSAFNRNGDDRQWYCRDCFRDYFKARGALHRKQVDIARVRRRSKSRQLVEARRRSGCVDCGVKDPLVLEFDHRDGDKVRHVAEMAWEGASPVSVTAELAKCDVVCVNCHKHRTYSRLPSCWRLDPIGIETNPRLANGAKRNLIYVRGLLNVSECVDCGLTDPVALEFDHRRDKLGNVTVMAKEACSLSRLQKEIAKCEIRCGNCHRRRTIMERRSLRTDPLKLTGPP